MDDKRRIRKLKRQVRDARQGYLDTHDVVFVPMDHAIKAGLIPKVSIDPHDMRPTSEIVKDHGFVRARAMSSRAVVTSTTNSWKQYSVPFSLSGMNDVLMDYSDSIRREIIMPNVVFDYLQNPRPKKRKQSYRARHTGRHK